MSQSLPPSNEPLTDLLVTLSPFTLLQSLSHELRAPLAAILGWTEWFAEGITDAQQQQEGIRHIRSAAGKMLQLLDDYSELARFGEAEGLAPASTDLLETLHRIGHGLELVAQPRQQSLVIEAEEQAPAVTVSPAVRQALWLVLRYALQVLPEAAVVRVHFNAAGQLRVESAQTPDANTKMGGLKLARLLIAREGGALAIEPRDAGMSILIQLPAPGLTTVPTPTTLTSPVGGVDKGSAPATKAKKVLVIDDDENLLKLLGAVVSAAGYCPYLATSGVRGLETARATKPDVVLLDIGMPGMDGFATFNILRAEPELARSKIVALTAYTGAAERERIALHGFDGFIPKPFRREQLIQVLSELSI
ncbi:MULTISPECIES: hybrid sensor histidine kinase/response regulator [Chloracidobacterium]|jgi:CheY-like chemotaxis protein|uniref:histidine kinase n=1 Tax=Chloracidobacterium thermophilum (strain B) TaxID=981222 RepID=G2LHX2_CHLTF|nr:MULTISPECIES: hybrid sensor histidine kinase/response regulator [Chloracidobacterium]AEP11032.1 Response regulators consisting of a CheY-like receiver domain and a winged-helix DNA-binding domain protein [Chloracidobacterium thermophilum B]QUV78954.1 response regulator [Chloracidobacterium thermophilum]QUV82001.1 response regulator [Chloracidobacterium sp. D]